MHWLPSSFTLENGPSVLLIIYFYWKWPQSRNNAQEYRSTKPTEIFSQVLFCYLSLIVATLIYYPWKPKNGLVQDLFLDAESCRQSIPHRKEDEYKHQPGKKLYHTWNFLSFIALRTHPNVKTNRFIRSGLVMWKSDWHCFTRWQNKRCQLYYQII